MSELEFIFTGIAHIIAGAIFLAGVIAPRQKCTLALYGRCMGCKRTYGIGCRGAILYAPMFEFSYNGRMYKTISRSSIMSRDLFRYQPGTIHPIWIDQNDPSSLVSHLQYSRKEISQMIFAIMLCFAGIMIIIAGLSFIFVF